VAVYDRIGTTYAAYRRPDPRIAGQIDAALGSARLVLDVGAGSGSYETGDRIYVAVEPSRMMIDQRAPGAAPVVQAVAERLPFPDRTFGAAMAILTMHHWPDLDAGLAELRRVNDGPIAILTWDPDVVARYWLVREYIPEFEAHDRAVASVEQIAAAVGACRIEPVLVPHDCTDGFFAGYWRRPEAYLDAGARAAISGLALLPDDVIDRMVTSLREDLASGVWKERHGDLLALDAYDCGYRLVIGAEP